MRRQVSLEEISDGKLYGRNDMVRVGTGGCRGCSSCCSGMGNSVILDPLDIYRLTTGLGLTFAELMTDKIELNVVDGVILPNLKMSAEGETCAFLDGTGRCSIHGQRPGICRLFPLGRYYMPREETGAAGKDGASGPAREHARGFRYFLQIHECPAPNKTKVKLGRWIDTPEPDRYERFVNEWHYFLEDVQLLLGTEPDACGGSAGENDSDHASGAEGRPEPEADERARKINLFLLKLFYVRPYEKGDFYGQFEERLAAAKDALEFG